MRIVGKKRATAIEVCSKIHVLKRSQILLKQEREGAIQSSLKMQGILLMTDQEEQKVSEYREGWEIGSAKGVHRVVWEPGEASGDLDFLW